MTSDLLEENQDLRKQVEELEKVCNKNMELADEIDKLEKENEELKRDKEDLIFIRNQKSKSMCEDKEKLAEAKEIIKKISDAYKYVIQYKEYANREILAEAEQFLKKE